MEKSEKCSVEIELEYQCKYSYKFHTVGNKNPHFDKNIVLLRTYMQNNKNILYIANPQILCNNNNK